MILAFELVMTFKLGLLPLRPRIMQPSLWQHPARPVEALDHTSNTVILHRRLSNADCAAWHVARGMADHQLCTEVRALLRRQELVLH